MNARLVGGAVALAKPERFGTLTLVGDDWQTVRARMYRLAYEVKNETKALQWCWHVEPNPEGTGQHVHFWQRGRYVPQAQLSRMAQRRGMGEVVDIRRWRQFSKNGVHYGVKLAGINYGVKDGLEDETLPTYLAANGGRLVHASRGFWLDRSGQACTQRHAMEEVARRNRNETEKTWVMIPREHFRNGYKWYTG